MIWPSSLACQNNSKATNSDQLLAKVSEACRKHGKIMGLAGIYHQPVIQDWAVNKLGVGFIPSWTRFRFYCYNSERKCESST